MHQADTPCKNFSHGALHMHYGLMACSSQRDRGQRDVAVRPDDTTTSGSTTVRCWVVRSVRTAWRARFWPVGMAPLKILDNHRSIGSNQA